MFEFSNRCTFIREERLAYFSIKNKKCASVGIVVYYWDNFISTQAIAGGKKSFGYPLLLFSRIGDKITLGIAAMIILWLLPHRWVINPVLTLCGTLSYELYLVHIQMLGLVHSPFSAWIMLIISLLVAYSFQKSFKQIQNFILK